MVRLYALSFLTALAIAAVLVEATGGSTASVMRALFEGSLGSPEAIGLTINETIPVLIVALGVIVASRAGVVNIGPEGQLLIGGLFGAAVALRLAIPGPLMIPAVLLASAIGGGLWAGIAALLRHKRGVDVVISTLLLNLIALQVVSIAVNRRYLLQETPMNGGISSPTTDQIPGRARLPILQLTDRFTVSSGIVIAVAVLIAISLLVMRSRWGFKLRMLGLNPEAARRAGVREALIGGGALIVSGAMAGLAGGVVLSDRVFRVQGQFANNLGYNGLLVALIARRHPGAAVPAALLFGILRAGGGLVASAGVPRYVVDVMQALIVLAALFPPLLQAMRDRRAGAKVARRQASERAVETMEAA